MKQWRLPALLALVSLIGLVAGLLADGYADVLSWLALGAVSLTSLLIAANAIQSRSSKS